MMAFSLHQKPLKEHTSVIVIYIHLHLCRLHLYLIRLLNQNLFDVIHYLFKVISKIFRSLEFSFLYIVDLTTCDYATLLRVAKVSNTNKIDRTSIQSNPSIDISHDKKRTRILFTSWQVAELERLFAEQKYVSAQERSAISMRIGLSPTQIKIWFQNRRYKSKKTTTTLFIRTT